MKLKSLPKTVMIAAFIAVVISIINYSFSNQLDGFYELAEDYAINFMFAFSLTLVNETFFSYFNSNMSWTQSPLKRLVLGVLGSVIITVITLFLLIAFTRMVIYGVSWTTFIASQRPSWYFFGIAFTLLISLIFHVFYFYKELQQSKIKEQKAIAGSATAQFDALKNQLDPHFLFNSLNVLVSLIEEDPAAAIDFTTSLSKVYRYVLEQRGKQLVNLEEELAFARTYVGLLKMRFEDSLDIEIPTRVSDPTLQIVPLSLQLLIENAVKHNIVSPAKPLQLHIKETSTVLIIENNLQEKQVLMNGTGVGLNNIASRYALLGNEKMTVEKSAAKFTVTLPLLDPRQLSPTMAQFSEEQMMITTSSISHL